MQVADTPSVTLSEALDRLEEMPRILHAAIADATAEALRVRAVADGFCLVEHACHLRDLEREGYAVRLHRMLAQHSPALDGFEGDVIAKQRDYVSQDAAKAAGEFALARCDFLEKARALGAAQMARTGSFLGRTITVCDLLAMMVEHDRGHREEIEALVRLQGIR